MTGPIDGSLIADGSIVRGKLARESVLPENRGRSNSVRSFAVNMPSPSTALLYTVPAGKTFIVTEVAAFAVGNSTGFSSRVTLRAGSGADRAYFLAPDSPSAQYGNYLNSFQAGIRFDSEEKVEVQSSSAGIFVTVSGYEY